MQPDFPTAEKRREDLEHRLEELRQQEHDPALRLSEQETAQGREAMNQVRIDSERVARQLSELPEPEPKPEPEVAPAADALAERESVLEANLRGLADQRKALSLDALSDESAARKLTEVESQIAEAEADLERLTLARSEKARRDAEAETAAEEKTRAAARKAADTLKPKRAKAAAAVDAAAAAFAKACAEHWDIASAQASALRAAGARNERVDQVGPREMRYWGSLGAACRATPSPLDPRALDVDSRLRKPLTESDAS